MKKKHLIFVFSGIATISETFTEQFSQFNNKLWQYIKEFFPDFQPDRPPLTVTQYDPEDCDRCGETGTVYPNPFNQVKQCHHCGYSTLKTRAFILKRLGQGEWIQEPVYYADFSEIYAQALKSIEKGFEVLIAVEKLEE